MTVDEVFVLSCVLLCLFGLTLEPWNLGEHIFIFLADKYIYSFLQVDLFGMGGMALQRLL